jgi:hypothetical protein
MTGSVAFSDSTTGVVLCTATVSDGVASCNLDPSDLAPGASTFVAVYLGDSSYAASSDTGSYTVSS